MKADQNPNISIPHCSNNLNLEELAAYISFSYLYATLSSRVFVNDLFIAYEFVYVFWPNRIASTIWNLFSSNWDWPSFNDPNKVQ